MDIATIQKVFLLAGYVNWRYGLDPATQASALGYKATLFQSVKDHGALYGMILEKDDTRTLVFGGTHNGPGWFQDSRIWLDHHEGFAGCTHSGFAACWYEVEDQVCSALADGKKFFLDLTGHSLGGAVALLAQRRLTDLGFTFRDVHTFGTPRVGDGDWADAFNLTHYRWVNYLDPIPRLPIYPYRHVGRMVWLGESGVIEPDPGIFTRLRAWAHTTIETFGIPSVLISKLIDYHIMADGYLPALAKNAGLP